MDRNNCGMITYEDFCYWIEEVSKILPFGSWYFQATFFQVSSLWYQKHYDHVCMSVWSFKWPLEGQECLPLTDHSLLFLPLSLPLALSFFSLSLFLSLFFFPSSATGWVSFWCTIWTCICIWHHLPVGLVSRKVSNVRSLIIIPTDG